MLIRFLVDCILAGGGDLMVQEVTAPSQETVFMPLKSIKQTTIQSQTGVSNV